jgi:hypothetical protein
MDRNRGRMIEEGERFSGAIGRRQELRARRPRQSVNEALASSKSAAGPREAGITRLAARTWTATMVSAIAPSHVISPRCGHGTDGVRGDVRSLIDMIILLQVGLRGSAALVAMDQIMVLPEDAAGLKAPRVVERTEERCEQ